MREQTIKEMNIEKDEISIQLRADYGIKGYGEDRWPLANFSGGIREIKLSRRGDVTTIKIRSPETKIYCEDVMRPAAPVGRRAKSADVMPR